MKNTIKIFVLFLTVTLLSCKQDYTDHMTGDAADGGAIIEILPTSSGKVLGVPLSSDLETTPLNITDNELNLQVALKFGGQDVSNYEVIKYFNGGSPTVVATSPNLPITINYTTLSDFLDGTGVTNPSDLRIGDTFDFVTKVIKNDGSEVFPVNGKYSVTVSCSSNLVATYDVTTTSSSGFVRHQGLETLIELGPGFYRTESTGVWLPSQLAPATITGFDFNDLCNSISIEDQNLAHFYSNIVYQTDDQAANSYVDPATGNLHIEYSITFSSGDGQYVGEYIKQ